MINKGYKHEDEMIYFMNNKQYKDLNKNLQDMLETMFGIVDPNETIKCEYAIERTKPDIAITFMGRTKYVSIKSGTSKIMHHENISGFVELLKNKAISERTIETILLFHYGDGTTDGSGKKRISLDELKYRLSKRIKEANKELNDSSEILSAVMNRAVFQGVRNDIPAADALYVGDYISGLVVTRKQIVKHIANPHKWDWMDSLHVGPLLIKAANRYIGKEIKDPEKREKMELYWSQLQSDIRYIHFKYDNYTPMRHRTYEE